MGMGLSPRVRGNRLAAAGRWRLGQSIPACAGEPPARPACAGSRAVYPRVCGGTALLVTAGVDAAGLSPRVRGNLGGTVQQAAGDGSIPACAGEPSAMTSPSRPPGVYPRVCGGTGRTLRNAVPGKGLSPRVRGNPGNDGGAVIHRRSIPACAGEPGRRGMSPVPTGVYPRVCGGTSSNGVGRAVCRGLSPRVRGNR